MGISHFRNRQAQWLDLVALVIVCCAGWTLRGMLLFGDDLIPGLNGAYYLVQARAILRSGLPGIPDFPLLFYLHAAWAGLMSFVLPRDQALIAAVKLTDTVVPVLLVIPVFMFVRSFAREHKVANNTFIATITIGLITVLNSSLLRMLGDFQKNAAGLPAGLLMIYFIYRATKYNRRHSYSLAVLFGVVSSITHIGVIALCATVIILFLVSSYFIKTLRKRVFITAIVVFFAFGIGLSIDLIFDQERVERLAGVVTSPSSIVRGPDSDMQRVPAPSPAGHGTPSFPDVILGLTLGILSIATIVLFRRSLDPVDRALLIAMSLTTLLFACPMVNAAWSQRFALMAFVPGVVPLAYLAVRHRWGPVVSITIAVITVVLTAVSIQRISDGELQGLTVSEFHELQSFRDYLPDGKTIVIARHGLEWWVAWTMDTHIASHPNAAFEVWEKYDSILHLIELTGNGQRNKTFRHDPGFPDQSGPIFRGPSLFPRTGITDGTNLPVPAGKPFQPDDFVQPGDVETVHEGKYYRLEVFTKIPHTHSVGGQEDRHP